MMNTHCLIVVKQSYLFRRHDESDLHVYGDGYLIKAIRVCEFNECLLTTIIGDMNTSDAASARIRSF